MAMAAPQTRWTIAMVRALPDDGKRYEIIDGELLVTPAPSFNHQEAVLRLYLRLDAYLRQHRTGHAYVAPADVEFSDDTTVEPDVFVVPLAEGRRPQSWAEAGRLLLAAEVLSPGTARVDRGRKRLLYQEQGVPEYWIVDGDARLIERWRPEDERPEVLMETLEWRPEPAALPFVLDVRDYFVEVFGD